MSYFKADCEFPRGHVKHDTRIHETSTIPDGNWQQYEGPQMGF